MKTIETTIYECEHCGKYYKSKYHCEKHELMCKQNPANQRACFGCSNLSMKNIIMEGCDFDHEVTLLHCAVKDEFVYPPKVEIKGNALDVGDNNPMPKECNDFKHEWES